ncbi:MAG: class I SAM-dependent methyltransferase [Bacteroidales bacterium]|nr:class I SAM-dependent methyltransferase [Bacteroidales bacterium]
MQERHTNREMYFNELAQTSKKYIIPYIEEFKKIDKDSKILEIGCGEGGNLLPFAQKGCDVTGVDISSNRIEQAKHFFSKNNANAGFIASDIFKIEKPSKLYDIIIIHDVIEHISHKKEFLDGCSKFLKNDGIICMGFPAWQMPFGGHQQICKSKVASHIPFIHILPKPLYKSYLKLCGESKERIDELLDIKDCATSIELFESLINESKYSIENRRLYFINPHYEIKFNLKPRLLNPSIGRVPYLRDFFSSSCFYILTKK